MRHRSPKGKRNFMYCRGNGNVKLLNETLREILPYSSRKLRLDALDALASSELRLAKNSPPQAANSFIKRTRGNPNTHRHSRYGSFRGRGSLISRIETKFNQSNWKGSKVL